MTYVMNKMHACIQFCGRKCVCVYIYIYTSSIVVDIIYVFLCVYTCRRHAKTREIVDTQMCVCVCVWVCVYVMRCDAMWCDVTWRGVTWYDVMWCDFGVVWCDVVWCDVTMWCDLLWYDICDAMGYTLKQCCVMFHAWHDRRPYRPRSQSGLYGLPSDAMAPTMGCHKVLVWMQRPTCHTSTRCGSEVQRKGSMDPGRNDLLPHMGKLGCHPGSSSNLLN